MTEEQRKIWLQFKLYSLAMVRFFPIQLFLLHLKRSWLFLTFWIVLFGMTGGFLFTKLGIPYLFLTPEYLEEVNPLAYFIVGVVLGLFTMAFHITSYIFYSHKFPFLATLSRPLYRFSFNNSIIPLSFYIFYIYQIVRELGAEGLSWGWIVANIAGLLGGAVLSVTFTFSWFFSTIRPRVFEKIGDTLDKTLRKIIVEQKSTSSIDEDRHRVVTYMKNFLSVRWARDTSHYGRKELLDILQQHHSNAALFLLLLTFLMLSLSWFVDQPFLMIPAGASIVLILTFYLMIVGAIYSRFKGWTFAFFLVGAFILNYVSGLPAFQRIHYAYGLDYRSEPADFSVSTLDSISSEEFVERDMASTIIMLEEWKKRTGEDKPKLVLLNSSGGGLRSSLWSMSMLQGLDTTIEHGFWNRVFLVTGSSGGMVGTAYYRELQSRLNRSPDADPNSPLAFKNMGRDILNPIGFTMVSTDIFFSLKRVQDAGESYPYDRGYSFERQLQHNLNGVLPKHWRDYEDAEKSASIPWMILSPTVINEGRRLLISNQGVSYLMNNDNSWSKTPSLENDGIDFYPFFANQRGDSLNTATALRMSATFPYITPLVSLPSEPRMEVIDAGARDNNGFELSLRFLYTFKDWIEENTSGVVFVQLMANEPPSDEIKGTPYKTRVDALIKPIGGVVNSFSHLQGFSATENLHFADAWIHFPVDIVSFELLSDRNEKVSLSWHLTEREKEFIRNSAQSDRINQLSMDLSDILN